MFLVFVFSLSLLFKNGKLVQWQSAWLAIDIIELASIAGCDNDSWLLRLLVGTLLLRGAAKALLLAPSDRTPGR